MRDSTLKALLWQGVGLLCYLAGTLLFLLVALSMFRGRAGGPSPGLTNAHLLLLVASVALLLTGRFVTWKVGGDLSAAFGPPEKNRLAELGYRVSPEPEDGDPGVVYRNGELSLTCRECGAENDPDYTYCRECSAELPDEQTALE